MLSRSFSGWTQSGRDYDSGMLFHIPNGPSARLVAGQSLTPPAGPRPCDHKPGEGRTLSSEDFERPCWPVAACAPQANSFHTRNYRFEGSASAGRGLSESDANSRLAWHSPLHRGQSLGPQVIPKAEVPRMVRLGMANSGHPSVRDIRRSSEGWIGCLVGRYLGSRRRSRSRHA